MLELSTYPAICPGCGSECEAVKFGAGERFLCDPCADADRARRRGLERRQKALAMLDKIIPEDFVQKIDPARINVGIRPALALSGTEGVGLIGGTGAGKTRVAYHLLRKAAAAGRMTYAICASRYRQCVALQHAREGSTAEILRACRFAQVLLLDDVGKGNTTEGGDEALFDLLTERRDHRRATIWTANGDGRWIAARFGADRGPAIAMRLANLAGCYGEGTGRIFKAGAEHILNQRQNEPAASASNR